MKKKYYRFNLFMVIINSVILVFGSGCKKLIEVDLPIDKITSEAAYSNVNTSVNVLNSIYAKLAKPEPAMGHNLAMVADEISPIDWAFRQRWPPVPHLNCHPISL